MPPKSKSQWDFGELFPPSPGAATASSVDQFRRILSVSELTEQVRRLLEKQVGKVERETVAADDPEHRQVLPVLREGVRGHLPTALAQPT